MKGEGWEEEDEEDEDEEGEGDEDEGEGMGEDEEDEDEGMRMRDEGQGTRNEDEDEDEDEGRGRGDRGMLRVGRAVVTSPPPPPSPAVTSPPGALTSLAAAVVARARGARGGRARGSCGGSCCGSSTPPANPEPISWISPPASTNRCTPATTGCTCTSRPCTAPSTPPGTGGARGARGGARGGPGGLGAWWAALAPLLAEANFQRVPDAAVAFTLEVQHPQDEAQVSLRPHDYDEIQFWALGQRVGPLPLPPPEDTPRRWSRPPPAPPRRYFRRVVVVARPRGGGLELGGFREVPLEALELLLGRGRVRTPPLARARLHLGLAAWGALLFLNLGLGLMADLKVGATGLLLALAALLTFRGAKAFSRRRAAAGLALAQARSRRATAQHGDLVAALTRRAQDEATKEALLARSFLPRCGGAGAGLEARLQAEVEAWLRRRFGLPLAFPARRACQRLRELGGAPLLPPPTPPGTPAGAPPNTPEEPGGLRAAPPPP
ncbi:transmembrane protein 143 [Athene noctua]|uniref:transmembrane protein 143 n=1 Tax=Athene noctua TaxID=126797 RepID=UPI003EBB3B3A